MVEKNIERVSSQNLAARAGEIAAGLSWKSRLIKGDCPQRSDTTTAQR